jgi:hypothetical protein
MQPERGWHHA